MKRHEYPSRDEAMRCRAEIQEAVQAAQRDEQPPKAAVAWPAGLDRTLLMGLPVQGRTHTCLARDGAWGGRGAYTVEQLLRVRYLNPPVLRDLLLTTDAFLAHYIETFDERPGPADVLAMRLTRAVESLTPAEVAVVEQRLLTDPPVEYVHLVLQLKISQARVGSALKRAERKCAVALGLELQLIAAELREGFGAGPAEEEVDQRIDMLLNEVLPDDATGTSHRARALFRLALVQELDLHPAKRSRRKRWAISREHSENAIATQAGGDHGDAAPARDRDHASGQEAGNDDRLGDGSANEADTHERCEE